MKTFSLFGMTLLLCACAVGPDFKTPDAPETKSYTTEQDTLPNEQKVQLGKALQAQWWTLFASPMLDDSIGKAIAGHYGIAAAKETLQEAQEMVKAQSGELLPQVSLGGFVTRQKYGVSLFGPSNFLIPPFTAYQLGPSASWMPDIFGGEQRRIERQQALMEYQKYELAAAYVELTSHVVAQALEIASTKEEIRAVENIVSEDEKNLKLTQKMFQMGTGTQVDILSAQSQLDADRALLPELKQRQSVARHALSILVGNAPAEWTPPDFAMSDFTLPQALPVSLPSELVKKRPDILAAEANLHAASATIGIAMANLYPTITLTANIAVEALTPAGLFKSGSDAWALAAGLTTPLFSGGTLTAEKHAAEHGYQAALAQYKQVILYAFGQVADALTALSHDTETMHMQEQAFKTAAASLDLARKSYQLGNSGLLFVQNAQRQLAQAQLELVKAKRQRYLDTAQLFVALGGSPITELSSHTTT